MYNETVLRHFQNPLNTGDIADADGIGEVGDPNCGDVIRLFIKVTDGKLSDVKYKTFGCAAAIAISSIASVMVMGKSLEDAAAITKQDIVDALDGLPEDKIACSTLVSDAIRAAIADYRSRSGKTSEQTSAGLFEA